MEKKFKKPESTIIYFHSDDIIVTSGGYGKGYGQDGDFWGDPADED